MALKYYRAQVKIGSVRLNYYVEADRLMSEPDLKDKLTSLASVDFIHEMENVEYDEYEEISVDIDMTPIDSDEFMSGTLTDYSHIRNELCVTMLTDSTNIIYSFLRVMNREVDEEEYGILVSASCYPDNDVDYIGVVNHDGISYQGVVDTGQVDCLRQLKRYFSADGTSLRRAIMVIAYLPPEEYEEMRQERELSLAI